MWLERSLHTRKRLEFVDITGLATEAVSGSGLHDGICVIYVPHTTAGVTLNENADPDVVVDLQQALMKMVPGIPFRHGEGNSPAHIQASLTGSSVTLPVIQGRLALGTWQGVYFCEFDGPRHRRVLLGCLGNATG